MSSIEKNKGFGARLKIVRQALCITQKDITSALKIPQPSLSRIEKGIYEPNIHLSRALADFLKINHGWLILGTGFPVCFPDSSHVFSAAIFLNQCQDIKAEAAAVELINMLPAGGVVSFYRKKNWLVFEYVVDLEEIFIKKICYIVLCLSSISKIENVLPQIKNMTYAGEINPEIELPNKSGDWSKRCQWDGVGLAFRDRNKLLKKLVNDNNVEAVFKYFNDYLYEPEFNNKIKQVFFEYIKSSFEKD